MAYTIVVATKKPFAPGATDDITDIANKAGHEVKIIEKYEGQDDLKSAASEADALIVRSDKVTREVIEAAPKLKIIARAGAGYDNVDLEAASEKGIVVMNTPGQNSNAVAELALGMMVYHARGHFNGKAGTELRNKKLGIHAFGHVGQFVAEIAHGFNMEVYAYDPFISKDEIKKHNVTPVDSEEELYSTCQYISLHIPANEKTEASINHKLMSKMPKNGVLVNTARKEVINEDDLLKVMEEREDFSYVSDIAPDCKDIFEEKYEGRFFFSPKKMGAQTREANVNAGIAAANQIVGYFKNGDTTFQVNA